MSTNQTTPSSIPDHNASVPAPSQSSDFVGFYDAASSTWQGLEPAAADNGEAGEDSERKRAENSRRDLREFLLSSLQMQHLAVLAGSGTSMGPAVNGPSMKDLWNACVLADPKGADKSKQKATEVAQKAMESVNFSAAVEADHRHKDNIEALLSRCEAFAQIRDDESVASFITAAKRTILDKCRGFLDSTSDSQLHAHRTFLHRLSRRRARDSRLKLFTTNYDLCFETAAGRQGLVSLDGFSFTQPRHFDPRFYSYDIVRRSPNAEDFGTPLEGVFVFYKLHGSVNWKRDGDEITSTDDVSADHACMIFPAAGKYQQSYIQPHLELMSQYLSSLREPNTCLIAIGYGFNDDHLSEPILAAVRTNPHLRLIVVSPTVKRDVDTNDHRYWRPLFELAKAGHDIRLINATFQQFAELIPDLKSLTPAEQLSKSIQRIAAPS
ncbi:MAG: SIR2 family protein [Phycisphaerae bacterium]|nr:SIR2 family protein [Phycisphaerae bacterium]